MLIGNIIDIEKYNKTYISKKFKALRWVKVSSECKIKKVGSSLLFHEYELKEEHKEYSVRKYNVEIKNIVIPLKFSYDFYISGLASDIIIDDQICHAMGSVNGVVYTNSYEAFLDNYKKGARCFEVDIYEFNGELLLYHPEKNHKGDFWIDDLNNVDFLNFKYEGKYKTLYFSDLCRISKLYNDCHFILDVKLQPSKKIMYKIFSLLFISDGGVNAQSRKIALIGSFYDKKMYNVNNTFSVFKDKYSESLDGFILQVNEYNSHIGLPLFKRFIWRDSPMKVTSDINCMSKLNILNYSINCERYSKIDTFQTDDINVFVYNDNFKKFKKRFVDDYENCNYLRDV